MTILELKTLLVNNNILLPNNRGINKNTNRFLKQHPEIMAHIIECTSFIVSTSPQHVKERLYCIDNEIASLPLCQQCKTNTTTFHGRTYGYARFCSPQCAQLNEQTRTTHKNIMLERYGVEYSGQSQQQKQKRRKTMLERYGVEYTTQSPILLDKIKQNNIKKFGRNNIAQVHINIETLNFLDDRDWLIYQHHVCQKSLEEICQQLRVDNTTVGNYCRKHNVEIKKFKTSLQQKQIVDFILLYCSNVSLNDRNIIDPKEIDIYIAEHKLAIEYCGLYWHSSANAHMSRNYHKQKLDACNKQNIRLITIFEDEWINNSDLVKQKILSIINKDERQKVYARKCKVVEVNTKTKQQFFDQYHIQGDGPSSINLGLSINDNVVACMAFIHQKGRYILNRYATSARVIGGFSKLLCYFKQNYQWQQIVSFADLRWSEGKLYEKCGFTLDKTLPPDYYYVYRTIRYHKFNFRHQYLPHWCKHYDVNLSESENTKNNNIFKIYNCGLLRYVMNNK